MKERMERTFRHLHGKHSDTKPAARRLGAFAAALALMAAIVLSPAQGIAYALTGEDDGLDVGNVDYSTYGLDTDGQENPEDVTDSTAEEQPADDTEGDTEGGATGDTKGGTTGDTKDPEQGTTGDGQQESGTSGSDKDGTDTGETDTGAGESGSEGKTDPKEDVDPDATVDLEGVNLEKYIVKSTVKWSKNGKDWKSLDDLLGGKLGYDYYLKFTLDYGLATGVLWSEDKTTYCDTAYYRLPDSLSKFSGEGSVTDASGKIVGQYEVFGGGITIRYDKDFVDNNKTNDFSGTVSFSGKVADLKADADGKVDIKFNEKTSCEVTVKPKPVDLTLNKTLVKTDVEANRISYSVEIGTQDGTHGQRVTLHDALSVDRGNNTQVQVGAKYAQDTLNIQVQKKTADGTTTTVPEAEEAVETTEAADGWKLEGLEASDFTLSLPALEAGETYTVTYQSEINDRDKIYGDFTIKNTAKASSGRREDEDFYETEEKTQETSITGLITKSGSWNENTHTVTWTVTLNKNRADLTGCVLRDFLNGTNSTNELNGQSVTVQRNNGTEFTAALPYYFGYENGDPNGTRFADDEKDNAVYTFTYTTPDTPKENNGNQAWNRAYLITNNYPNGDRLDANPYATQNVGVKRGGYYNKEGLGVKENPDGTTLTLKWRLTLQPVRTLAGGWTLTDTMNEGQYLTPQQLTELEQAVQKQLGQDCTVRYTSSSNTFTVTGTKEWPSSKTLTLEYFSTRKRDVDAVRNYTFTNQATLENYQVTGYNYYHEGTVVQKLDSSSGTAVEGAETDHEYHALKNGQLKWDIIITASEKLKQAETLTVTETLPDGVTLTGLKFKRGSFFGSDIAFSTQPDSGLWTASNGASATVENGVVTLTIPQSVYNRADLHNQTFTLEVTVTPTNANRWEHDTTYPFTNKVSVSGGELSAEDNTASQTQKNFNNENYDAITKTGQTVEGAYNQIRYRIVVNPNGLTYQTGTDRLKLTDTMERPNGTTLFLEDTQVKIYDYTGGVQGAELGTNEYSYTYEERDSENVLTFHLPNSRPLMVEYVYRVKGTAGKQYTLKNHALLEGTSSQGTSSESDSSYTILESSSTVKVNGITLYKVDSANYGKHLQGAVFTLEQWNSQTQKWETVIERVTSDADGLIKTVGADGKTLLKTGVAYRLTELTAPHGYQLRAEPFDFYIDTAPADVPADYAGQLCNTSQRVYISNAEGYYTPELTKNIVENGELVKANTADHGETVNFQLTIQVAHGQPKDYVLHDTMSGLDFDAGTLKITHGVKVNGEDTVRELDAGAYTLTANANGFTVAFANDKLTPGDKLTVTYSGTVRQDAVEGAEGKVEGNPNTAWMEYADPYGTDKTPNKETRTYVPVHKTDVIVGATSGFDLYKYTVNFNGDEKPLADAKFVLYRQLGETRLYAKLDSDGKAVSWTPAEADATVVTTPESGRLHFEGLPAGAYCLQETEAPLNYEQLAEPVRVVLKQLADRSFVLSSDNAVVEDGIVRVENSYIKVPATPVDPSDVPEEPETPASSDSREEESASSETTPEQPAESEQPASSDSGEQPASPEEDASSLRPGAPTPDNQDGWVLGEHGKDDPAASSDASKPGAPMPDNQKGWVLGAKDGTGLIQTGQLNWPVPVLIALGAALIAAGVWLNRRAKRHRN